jgi:ATP-dependent Clp protease ATP-binding subunit ClpA
MLLRKSLRPEFLNRVDEIVMFRLTLDQIREIVRFSLITLKRCLRITICSLRFQKWQSTGWHHEL